MAKTALNSLEDQIEAVRREAFAAGYAAAMQSIRELTTRPIPGAATTAPRSRSGRGAATTALAARPTRQRRVSGERASRRAPRAAERRPQRGTNARLITEVLQLNAPRALRPAEIRSALRHDKGVAVAFTSIRHALGQLEARHAVEQVGDSKTWRYRDQGNPTPSS